MTSQTLTNITDEGGEEPGRTLLNVSLTLRGSPSTIIHANGELRTVLANVVADYNVPFGVGQNHVAILVNSITGSGDITVNGASVNNFTGVVTVGDSEVMSVDGSTSQYYKTNSYWWECTSITVGAGITAIDYDIVVIGYLIPAFRDLAISGHRVDMIADGVNPDIRFRIIKVVNDAGHKVSLIDLENIAVDSGAGGPQILDGLRTGLDNRDFDPVVTDLWQDQENLTFSAGDFQTYFTAGENHFLTGSGEGIIVRFEGAPVGGISNIDVVNIIIALVDI